MKKIKQFLENEKIQEIARFMLGGVPGVSLSYLVFYMLTDFWKVWYLSSSIFTYFLGYFISFFFQKFWAFKNTNSNDGSGQLFVYLDLAFIYFLINTYLMYLFVDKCHLDCFSAQGILIVVLAISNYFTTKKIVFAR